jgi:hypothetical protein
MNRVWSRVIVAAALAVSAVGLGAVSTRAATGGPDALQLFVARVAAYAELHQRLDAVFPPWRQSDDVHAIFRRREYLGSAIRAARQNARQGDIFEPAVAVALRDVVANALNGVDVEQFLRDLYEECDAPAGYRAQVNMGYPKWATHEVPSTLLAELPQLPTGIFYRLIDHDLLLWDVDADLIIDVLPDALPRAGS